MRIALHATGHLGQRAARMLLAEPALTSLGLWGANPPLPRDRRIRRHIEDLRAFDVVVDDSPDGNRKVVKAALQSGISCVLAGDGRSTAKTARDNDAAFAANGETLLTGANPRAGIGPALAAQEAELCEEPLQISIGWTTIGRPRRRGEALPFPRPVGSLWGRKADCVPWPETLPITPQCYAAPVEGPWAGVVARVHGIVDEGVTTRVVGVSEDADHLEAIALTTAAVAVAADHYPAGSHWPASAPAHFLERALAIGLEVAAFTIPEGVDERSSESG